MPRYDHPSFLTRQCELVGVTTAGANGTSSGGLVFPWDINVHTVLAVVKTAGTSAGAGNQAILLAGTATLGSVALGTNTAGYVGTSGDLATKVTAGTPLYIKNGTDATGVCWVNIEWNAAPDTATFVGNE